MECVLWPNDPYISFNQICKAGNRHYELSVLIYILWTFVVIWTGFDSCWPSRSRQWGQVFFKTSLQFWHCFFSYPMRQRNTNTSGNHLPQFMFQIKEWISLAIMNTGCVLVKLVKLNGSEGLLKPKCPLLRYVSSKKS